jgi:hypothetical protein
MRLRPTLDVASFPSSGCTSPVEFRRDLRPDVKLARRAAAEPTPFWFLQDIGVLPSSFMTGQIRWAILEGLR